MGEVEPRHDLAVGVSEIGDVDGVLHDRLDLRHATGGRAGLGAVKHHDLDAVEGVGELLRRRVCFGQDQRWLKGTAAFGKQAGVELCQPMPFGLRNDLENCLRSVKQPRNPTVFVGQHHIATTLFGATEPGLVPGPAPIMAETGGREQRAIGQVDQELVSAKRSQVDGDRAFSSCSDRSPRRRARLGQVKSGRDGSVAARFVGIARTTTASNTFGSK